MKSTRKIEFDGHSVVITGGSSGLGLSLAEALAARGARISLVARDQARLDGAAAHLRARHPGSVLRTLSLDVTDSAAVTEEFAQCERIDMLINSAGILREGYFETLPDAAFRDVMEINLFGAINMIRATLPQLRAAHGRIVNIASAAGLTGVFGYTPYCAAKHALVGFSEALRYELEPEGLAVHVVCPGEFGSPMVDSLERTRTPENRAHTLTIPKRGIDTIVRETLRGIDLGRALIVPGARARAAILTARMAPGLTRAIGARRIASVYRGPQRGLPANGKERLG